MYIHVHVCTHPGLGYIHVDVCSSKLNQERKWRQTFRPLNLSQDLPLHVLQLWCDVMEYVHVYIHVYVHVHVYTCINPITCSVVFVVNTCTCMCKSTWCVCVRECIYNYTHAIWKHQVCCAKRKKVQTLHIYVQCIYMYVCTCVHIWWVSFVLKYIRVHFW